MTSETFINHNIQPLEVVEGATVGNLRAYGLHRPKNRRPASGAALDYLTLDEAMARELVEIGELGRNGGGDDAGGAAGERASAEGGTHDDRTTPRPTPGGDEVVGTIEVHNKCETHDIFIKAGEDLIGAKQNRALNTSVMVPAGQRIEVPVSCTEQGRWHYKSDKFGSGGSSGHAHLRAKMAAQVSDNYRRVRKAVSDQAEVWSEIEHKMALMGAASPSSEHREIIKTHQARLDEILEKMPVPKDCCGVLFAVGNRVAAMDVFDQESTLHKLWPKLVKASALDALEEDICRSQPPGSPERSMWEHFRTRMRHARPFWRRGSGTGEDSAGASDWPREDEGQAAEPLDRREAERFVATVSWSRTEAYPSPGDGQDIRLRADRDDIVGACLAVKEQAVHCEAYPREESGPRRPG